MGLSYRMAKLFPGRYDVHGASLPIEKSQKLRSGEKLDPRVQGSLSTLASISDFLKSQDR